MGLVGLYENFLLHHEAQLKASGVPSLYWPTLYSKLHSGNLDAGRTFQILKFEYDEECNTGEEEAEYRVVVGAPEGLSKEDDSHVYLIDHAWIFEPQRAREHLCSVEGLLSRMANLMCVKEGIDKIEAVEKSMWKYNQTFSIASESEVEKRMPLWYIMDEFGSAIQHSDDPTFRTVPFYYLPENISYSLLYPLRDVAYNEEVTRDYAEGTTDPLTRRALLLPWRDCSFADVASGNLDPPDGYFSEGRLPDSLPEVSEPVQIPDDKILKVYSQYKYINEYLTHPRFDLAADPTDADILWLTTHFRDYKDLEPRKFVNQFPYESVLTVKDMVCCLCRGWADKQPDWMLTTYNLKTELPQFVSYYKQREANGEDNHWIIKPWNLARGLDTHISDDINCIVRLSTSGPKISQKYITNPVLYYREGLGRVKFDVRYVVLLKSVRPLRVFAYTNFFLRFANVPFSLDELYSYEKHFTVMNYTDESRLCKVLCGDFIPEFESQNGGTDWKDVESKIFKMMKETFLAVSRREPPCGLGASPRSRALYAVDLMLEHDRGGISPKLLEVNWTPDCRRACQYYPDFYNVIFAFLFLDQPSDNIVEL